MRALILAACIALAAGAAEAKAPPDPLKANAAYLAKQTKAKGVVTVPGIQYRVLKSGPADGAHPTRNSAIKIRYEGRLLDGTVFDASARNSADGTAIFPLNRLISGWVVALQLMRPGDEWEVTIPPELAYGAADRDPIPANSVLIFRIELIDFAPLPPQPSPTLTELPPKP